MYRIDFPKMLERNIMVSVGSTGKDVGAIQSALVKLKLKVSSGESVRKEFGTSTVSAIKAFQNRVGLPPNGTITEDAVIHLNANLAHFFITGNKNRTAKFQDLLQQSGQKLDVAELKSRKVGPSTEQAIKAVQLKFGLPQDGLISEALVNKLREENLTSKLTSKGQVAQLHKTLLRAVNLAGLKDLRVDSAELKQRTIGPSTQATIKALQTKYRLPVTGTIDVATYDLLNSIGSSVAQPKQILKAASAAELKPLKKLARLNQKNQHIGDLQQGMAFLGYKIDEAEFKEKKFGATTRMAVLSYQKTRGLAQTGHVDGVTLRSLNREIMRANPQAAAAEFSFRIRGSVRDEKWQGMVGMTVQVWEKPVQGDGTKLAERKTGNKGFFDLPYDPPREAATRKVKQPFTLQIKVVDAGNNEIASKQLFNPTQIAWMNFTQGEYPYRGTSVFEERLKAVSKAISPGKVADLVETASDRQISRAAQLANVLPEDVMSLVLAYRVAQKINVPSNGPEVCYAFIAQSLPSSLPGNLLEATVQWTLIERLVEQTSTDLVLMEPELQAQALTSARELNLIPVSITLQQDTILAALAELRTTYALDKPLLSGNGQLRSLLALSAVDAGHQAAVASAFLKHQGMTTAFWADLASRPADFGGEPALRDLRTTLEVGQVTKNFTPLISFLKKKIDDPADTSLHAARDLAKKSQDEWLALLQASGGQVPASVSGATDLEKQQTYAATLTAQSERLFPDVALVARVAGNATNPVPAVDRLQKLMDDHPDFNLRRDNFDSFIREKQLSPDPDTLTSGRVLQRVRRIAPTAQAGVALLEKSIHSSGQIVAMGKGRFIDTMAAQKVDPAIASGIFERAEFQYAQVLQRLADYRFDLHRSDPAAIINHKYGPDELPAEVRANPDLATLFGSLDFCDCPHCQSVYGPAAYLADLLRFLDTHPTEIAGKTVKDFLFERRPDLGNIKLNCANTETPLPYIDLVNEVLENAVAAPNPNPDFTFQTTASAPELKAAPEHTREEAYHTLRHADYPLNVAFDLWREQARVFLDHLGVSRWELMRVFQTPGAGSPVPSDASIASEYFQISPHETALITTPSATIEDQLKVFWGLNAATLPGTMSVAEFMQRTFLNYEQVLNLLALKWINAGAASAVEIERPDGTCDTSAQKVVHLTPEAYDRIHRFLRVYRHLRWTMWELDLLLRSPALGKGILDESFLVKLHGFDLLSQRLPLSVEQLLTLWGDLNTEIRVKSLQPAEKEASLYETLFLNKVVFSPVDPSFTLPIAAGQKLMDHQAVIQAALSLTAEETQALIARIPAPAELSLANLSVLARHAFLAHALKLNISSLLSLIDLIGKDALLKDPELVFKGSEVIQSFIEDVDWLTKSGFSIAEVEYLLWKTAEPLVGLRRDVAVQWVEAVRSTLRARQTEGDTQAIIQKVASLLNLTTKQTQLLVEGTNFAGKTFLVLLQDPQLIPQKPDGSPEHEAATFTGLISALDTLHRSAMIIQRLKLDEATVEWLLKHANEFDLWQLNSTQKAPDDYKPESFTQFLKLLKWSLFNALLAEKQSLTSVFDLIAGGPVTSLRSTLVTATGWAELKGVLETLDPGADDFKNIDSYWNWKQVYDLSSRLGISSDRLKQWVMSDGSDAEERSVAQEARQAAKAKYDGQTWLTVVAPLENKLREKKREALVNYLIATSVMNESPEITVGARKYANPKYWDDSNALLSYFLIDVEMSACQLTSRIKQAISAVQMFVQRCLLGREQPRVEVSQAERQDASTENSWRQWKWLKNYRVWEANRKIFLYPENWIEPELRDDKSPFFKELETELLQGEMTEEMAEAAFVHYLQKVHEVSRLDVVSTYHEIEDTNPADQLPPEVNRLHVVARTRAMPAIYYYRIYDLNYNTWSAWEKIDLDIQGDHVVPVVYNRQLHLFWLHFMEKPQKVRKLPPAAPTGGEKPAPIDAPDPPNQLEIQLCWSVHKADGWTAKRLSRQKLIHPWQRPQFSYHLRPRYKALPNELWLDIFISQSVEFNRTQFWDGYANTWAFATARKDYDESARPWHSSTFVFDGEITSLRMKALAGQYHLMDTSGRVSNSYSPTDAVTYLHLNFGAEGRAIDSFGHDHEIAPRVVLPGGMHYHTTRLVNNKYSPNPSTANVLQNASTVTLLRGVASPFELVGPQQYAFFDSVAFGLTPFIFQDKYRSFFIQPHWQTFTDSYNKSIQQCIYTFKPFYHAYTKLFLRELHRSGLDGLLNRRIQLHPEAYAPTNTYKFNFYVPSTSSVPDATATTDQVNFELYDAYSIYNWEIFFHAPLMIACRLTQNRRFEEAMRWFHYIFDPTNTETEAVPQRYWITKPFFEQNSEDYRKQRIENLLKNIDQYRDAVRAWKNNPFKPHLVARYRPVAYQKTVVMKYIDNLIAWGDYLFGQDTMESINEATTLYVLAYELLGKRPIKVPKVDRQEKTFNELTEGGALDPFGNKQVDVLMENFVGSPVRITRSEGGNEPLPTLNVAYFGIPNNTNLLRYWDTVEDRLFKIRNCMNLQGVVRQLPLFEPEIDPALLVKAAAAGLDVSSVVNPSPSDISPYRFRQLIQKAEELCAEVRGLGEKLLSALEKQDGEGLALLRSTHELTLQKAVREIKLQQIKEAAENIAGLEQSQVLAQKKLDYYKSRENMNDGEKVAIGLNIASITLHTAATLADVLAGAMFLIPDFHVGASGFGGSPHFTAKAGGENVAQSGTRGANGMYNLATILDKGAGLASTLASYGRRKDDWDFQADLATTELAQIEKQLLAAQIRSVISEKDLENHELQMEQSQAVDEYMRSKFSSSQLYQWQVAQISGLYFQSYQLAFDMAKRAERCYQFEREYTAQPFIQFGAWDSLKKGLMAGDRLAADLRRLEAAYLKGNQRDLEVTKHISLAQVDPLSLLQLKEGGECTVRLPEWLFDLDYPGHYFRKIKSVSLSIPAVAGPYTSVNCTLSLTNHAIRVSKDVAAGYGDPLGAADARFFKSVTPQVSIATSHGQNDSGMFELNFNDERYLPFEGVGAVSEWNLKLPVENNQFDLASVSDVILHLRYTARASGETSFENAARDNLKVKLPASGLGLFSLTHDFATEWHRFLHPLAGEDQVLRFTVRREHLPFFMRNKAGLTLNRINMLVEGKSGVSYTLELTPPMSQTVQGDLKAGLPSYGERQVFLHEGFTIQPPALGEPQVLGEWQVKIQKQGAPDFRSLSDEEFSNAYLVAAYTAT